MDAVEIAKELLGFLNNTGQYRNFLTYMEERGFDAQDLEADCDAVAES